MGYAVVSYPAIHNKQNVTKETDPYLHSFLSESVPGIHTGIANMKFVKIKKCIKSSLNHYLSIRTTQNQFTYTSQVLINCYLHGASQTFASYLEGTDPSSPIRQAGILPWYLQPAPSKWWIQHRLYWTSPSQNWEVHYIWYANQFESCFPTIKSNCNEQMYKSYLCVLMEELSYFCKCDLSVEFQELVRFP